MTRTEQSFIVQLQSGFKCYFRNKDKASHTLLAYLLLSDIDQLVLMFTGANREAGNSVEQTASVLRLKARARLLNKKKKEKNVIFGINILLASQ